MISRSPGGAQPRACVMLVLRLVSSTARQSLPAAMRGDKVKPFQMVAHDRLATIDPDRPVLRNIRALLYVRQWA